MPRPTSPAGPRPSLRQAVRARLARGAAVGQDARPGPALPADVVAGTRARYVEAFERITGRQLRPLPRRRTSSPDERQPIARFRFAVNVTAQGGHPRPAGPGRGAEPAATSASTGVRGVRVGRRVELTVEAADEAAARAIVERLAGELLVNPLIEAYEVEARRRSRDARAAGRMTVRVGVVVFPGSNCDRDALHARRASPAPSRCRCGTSRPTSRASTRVVLPGGFAYGDYLRAGVIARFSPVMRAVARASPPTAASCSASATASRSWPRRASCPARCCATAASASCAARSRIAAERLDTPFTRAVPAGRAAADARRPRRGLLLRRRGDARRARARRPGPLPLRATGRRPTGDAATRTARCAASPA